MTDQELLTEAKTALHALLTGAQVVSLRDQNGEMVTYNQASVAQLRRYISELQTSIAGLPITSQPLGFFF